MTTETWTGHDEAELKKLQRRKAGVMAKRRGVVESTVKDFFYRGMCEDDLVARMIEHADAIRVALEPFDGGRTVGMEDEVL